MYAKERMARATPRTGDEDWGEEDWGEEEWAEEWDEDEEHWQDSDWLHPRGCFFLRIHHIVRAQSRRQPIKEHALVPSSAPPKTPGSTG